jgi:hypothetical protein
MAMLTITGWLLVTGVFPTAPVAPVLSSARVDAVRVVADVPRARLVDDAVPDVPRLGAEDLEAMRAVVQGQLDAFAANDGDRAFGFASPGIRDSFGDSGAFMQMVREGYAPLVHPGTVRFLPVRLIEGAPAQVVELSDDDGTEWIAVYRLRRETDGRWSIDGCTLLRVQEGEPPKGEQDT